MLRPGANIYTYSLPCAASECRRDEFCKRCWQQIQCLWKGQAPLGCPQVPGVWKITFIPLEALMVQRTPEEAPTQS